MRTTTPRGQIITFYSYKGGTGRSMAVANLACLLSRRLEKTSQRVLVMDWDLEAPGLHRYFSAKCDQPQFRDQEGLMNYFSNLRELLSGSEELSRKLEGKWEAPPMMETSEVASDAAPPLSGTRLLEQSLPLERFITPDVVPGVDFMRAGRLNEGYGKLVSSFNWQSFYDEHVGAITAFRDLLAEKFAYVLIDSRTGITDVSSICTALFPEKLVGVFVPNKQNLYGLSDIAGRAISYRSQSDDFRPLAVFPLPSRVENAEQLLKHQWRKEYQAEFERVFKEAYDTATCDLGPYFDDVLLPHVSFYAYGEKLALLEQQTDAVSLGAAYLRFFDRLLTQDFAWEQPEEEEPEIEPAVETAGPPVTNAYDVYLGCADDDAAVVANIQKRLASYGVTSFLPAKDILPGEDVSARKLAAMKASRAIAVFLGRTGAGPWQDQKDLSELEGFAKDSSKRIVPVQLPEAVTLEKANVPTFLRSVAWLTMRDGVRQEDVSDLMWSLTGRRPAPTLWMRLQRFVPWVAGFVGLLVLITAIVWEVGRFETSHSNVVNPTPLGPAADPNAPGGMVPLTTNQTPNATSNGTVATDLDQVYTPAWDQSPPERAFCYQELGSARSAAWKLKAGQYGAYCHYSQANCQKAAQGAATASACAYLDFTAIGQNAWGGVPVAGGLYHSWYRLNMALPLKPPFPQIPGDNPVGKGDAGIVVSTDTTWPALDQGAGSAAYEVKLLAGYGYKNAYEFEKGGLFITVLVYSGTDTGTLSSIKANLVKLRWTGAQVVQIDSWCPAGKLGSTLRGSVGVTPHIVCN